MFFIHKIQTNFKGIIRTIVCKYLVRVENNKKIEKNEDGSEAYRAVGVTIGENTINIGEQTLRNGMFKIPVPNGDFLNANQTIEVEKAYRGGADPTSPRVHMTLPEDIQVPIRTVIDITLPSPATEISDYDKIAN